MAVSQELLLLSAITKTGDYKVLGKAGITPSMFHQYPDEGKWLFDYIDRYRRAPSRTTLRNEWPDLRIYKTEDTEYHADELRKAHVQHGIMSLIENAVDNVDAGNTERALAQLQKDMLEIQMRQHGMADDYDVFEEWTSTYNDVAARVDRVSQYGLAGCPTGFPSLDEFTGGWQAGWMAVIAARLGQGKTMTGIRSGWAAASAGWRCQYWSLEQSRHQVAMRLHSFASASHGQRVVFDSLALTRGKDFSLKDYKKFLEELRADMGDIDGKFFVNDTSRGRVTPLAIAAGIERATPDVVFIDYLTLMGKSGNDWQATASLSGEIKALAERYQTPIVCMSQVNRLGAGKEPPNAENLSQADAIGHDADVLVTMARQSKRVMKLRLAKFRHGPDQQWWYCKFAPGTGQYEEITGNQAIKLMDSDEDDEE